MEMLFIGCFTAALWMDVSVELVSNFAVYPELRVQALLWHCATAYQLAAPPWGSVWLFTLEMQRQ